MFSIVGNAFRRTVVSSRAPSQALARSRVAQSLFAYEPAKTTPLFGRQLRDFATRPAASSSSSKTGLSRKQKISAVTFLGFAFLPGVIYFRCDDHGCKNRLTLPSYLVAEAEASKATGEHKRTDVTGKDSTTKFTRSEVSAHNSLETGVWVVHGDGVYDVTEFIKVHPGGDRIMLAAGRSVEPFWNIFTVHNTPETRQLLEAYRIGTVADIDPTETEKEARADLEALERLFVNEPELDSSLIVRSARPCNAEAARESLLTYLTSNRLFYVRNHLPVPAIEESEFRLAVNVPRNDDPVIFNMEDIRKFPKYSITATLQCAGNRRRSMHDVKPTKGLLWEVGAIGNATWAGARLSDILAAAGYDVASAREGEVVDDVEHVWLDGAEGYGASVPVQKVADPLGDVILAYEMNGEPIPSAHGFPLRAVVPGHVAARSVKWVNKITLAHDESPSHWQQRDYKGFSPSATQETSDYQRSVSIQEMPIQSAIISPSSNATVRVNWVAPEVSRPAGSSVFAGQTNEQPPTVTVCGYAWSGGGRGIVRVDVSADGGSSWVDAALLSPEEDVATMDLREVTSRRHWAWTQWVAEVPVPADALKKGGRVELVCKAVDSSYNIQPEDPRGIYNIRGVLSNAWHRVPVEVELE